MLKNKVVLKSRQKQYVIQQDMLESLKTMLEFLCCSVENNQVLNNFKESFFFKKNLLIRTNTNLFNSFVKRAEKFELDSKSKSSEFCFQEKELKQNDREKIDKIMENVM